MTPPTSRLLAAATRMLGDYDAVVRTAKKGQKWGMAEANWESAKDLRAAILAVEAEPRVERVERIRFVPSTHLEVVDRKTGRGLYGLDRDELVVVYRPIPPKPKELTNAELAERLIHIGVVTANQEWAEWTTKAAARLRAADRLEGK